MVTTMIIGASHSVITVRIAKNGSYGNLKRGKKKMPKVGDKIRIIYMEGEPQYAGREGIVEFIDDAKQIHGTWGGCALIPGSDSWEIIK